MPKPRVMTHNVASLDGRLTIGPGVLLLHGDERWDSVVAAGDAYDRLRREFDPDAILEGSGSFVVDDGSPPRHAEPPVAIDGMLHRDYLPAEVVERPDLRGWFVVVDGRGRVRWQFKEYPDPDWSGWHLLVLACARTPAGYLGYLQGERIPYLVTGDDRVDLAAALERLSERLGVHRVLATGGGRLGGALLRAGLIDEVSLEMAPALIGGDATPALFDGPPLTADEWPARLEVTDLRLEDGRLELRARVVSDSAARDRADVELTGVGAP
jgi:2,5-diamino-6-(ribosylamino)-4(3H)-pyrimidinone 5'-phosphate reductase